MKPLLIFDYDGTIHNTIGIYEPAFRKAHKYLLERRLIEPGEVSTERIAGWLGMNTIDMWKDFAPQLTPDIVETVSQMVASSMADDLYAGKAVWYEGAEDVLGRLKAEGYTMVILSNCRVQYREAHMQVFPIADYFDRFYDCESYNFIPKSEIIKSVVADYGVADCIMIGDRGSDMDAGKAVGARCVGCLYGFGSPDELKSADVHINDISELTNEKILWG